MLAEPRLLKFFPIYHLKYQKKKDANKADAILIARFFHETVGNL